MSKRSIMTRFHGRYVNNDDLQKIMLEDALKTSDKGDYATSNYLKKMVANLEKLKD